MTKDCEEANRAEYDAACEMSSYGQKYNHGNIDFTMYSEKGFSSLSGFADAMTEEVLMSLTANNIVESNKCMVNFYDQFSSDGNMAKWTRDAFRAAKPKLSALLPPTSAPRGERLKFLTPSSTLITSSRTVDIVLRDVRDGPRVKFDALIAAIPLGNNEEVRKYVAQAVIENYDENRFYEGYKTVVDSLKRKHQQQVNSISAYRIDGHKPIYNVRSGERGSMGLRQALKESGAIENFIITNGMENQFEKGYLCRRNRDQRGCVALTAIEIGGSMLLPYAAASLGLRAGMALVSRGVTTLSEARVVGHAISRGLLFPGLVGQSALITDDLVKQCLVKHPDYTISKSKATCEPDKMAFEAASESSLADCVSSLALGVAPLGISAIADDALGLYRINRGLNRLENNIRVTSETTEAARRIATATAAPSSAEGDVIVVTARARSSRTRTPVAGEVRAGLRRDNTAQLQASSQIASDEQRIEAAESVLVTSLQGPQNERKRSLLLRAHNIAPEKSYGEHTLGELREKMAILRYGMSNNELVAFRRANGGKNPAEVYSAEEAEVLIRGGITGKGSLTVSNGADVSQLPVNRSEKEALDLGKKLGSDREKDESILREWGFEVLTKDDNVTIYKNKYGETFSLRYPAYRHPNPHNTEQIAKDKALAQILLSTSKHAPVVATGSMNPVSRYLAFRKTKSEARSLASVLGLNQTRDEQILKLWGFEKKLDTQFEVEYRNAHGEILRISKNPEDPKVLTAVGRQRVDEISEKLMGSYKTLGTVPVVQSLSLEAQKALDDLAVMNRYLETKFSENEFSTFSRGPSDKLEYDSGLSTTTHIVLSHPNGSRVILPRSHEDQQRALASLTVDQGSTYSQITNGNLVATLDLTGTYKLAPLKPDLVLSQRVFFTDRQGYRDVGIIRDFKGDGRVVIDDGRGNNRGTFTADTISPIVSEYNGMKAGDIVRYSDSDSSTTWVIEAVDWQGNIKTAGYGGRITKAESLIIVKSMEDVESLNGYKVGEIIKYNDEIRTISRITNTGTVYFTPSAGSRIDSANISSLKKIISSSP